MPAYHFGPFVLDTVAERLERDGVSIDVQPLQLKLLAHLVHHAGQLVERGALAAILWPDVHVTDHSLTQAVHKARYLLGDHSRWIKTVPRRGFRFEGAVEQGSELRDGYVGRAEVADIARAWHSTRVVALLGPGGAGKTRLALEYLKRDCARWPQALVVDLVPVTTPTQMVHAMAEQLDVPLRPGELDVAVAQIGAALAHRGEVLVLLDNLEHLQPEADAVLSAWHGMATSTRWLVTSRIEPDVPCEAVRVPRLSTAQGRLLFLDRARAAGASIESMDEAEVDALVEGLGGSPLAIEIVAARAPMLSPADLRERLGRGVLQRSDGPERHRSMRAAFESSYDLLDAHEQRVFAQCALFPSGLTVALAEGVVDGSRPVMDVLEALRRCSLLERIEAQANPIAGRLRMAPLVREYALAHLPPDDPARERFVRVMRGVAREAASYRFDGDVPGSRRLLPEAGNLFAAAEMADAADAIPLILDTQRALRAWGRIAGLMDLVDLLPDPPPGLGETALLARAEASHHLDDSPALAERALEGVEVALARGDEQLAADLALAAGALLGRFARLADARAVCERAITLYRAGLPDTAPMLAFACFHAGVGAMNQGDVTATEDLTREGLAALPPGRAPAARIALLDLKGYVAGLAGRHDEAERDLRESLALAERHNLPLRRANVLSNLGSALGEAGRLHESLAIQERALAEAMRLGMPTFAANVLNNRSNTRLGLDDPAGAETDALEGLSLVQPDDRMVVFLRSNLATAAMLQRRWPAARRQGADVLRLATEMGHTSLQADAVIVLLVADLGEGRLDLLPTHLAQAAALQALDLPVFVADTLEAVRAIGAACRDGAPWVCMIEGLPATPFASHVRRALEQVGRGLA